MEFAMDLAQAVSGHVRINLGCADVRMAEQFLDDAEIGAVFEQVRRKTMAQHVGSDVAGNAGTPGALFDAQPECDRGKGRSALCQKDRGG